MKRVSLHDIMQLNGRQEFIVSPILPKGVIATLVGESSIGKTQFAFQLSAAIAAGKKEFLSMPLNAKWNRVALVLTEDTPINVKERMEYLLRGVHPDVRKRIDIYHDVEGNPIKRLEKDMKENPVDLLLIDNWLDFFNGNLNQSNEVRQLLNEYSRLAENVGCSVLFLHHFNKASDNTKKTKSSMLGSQGIEAKMRSVIALEWHRKSYDRQLTILKNNYVSKQTEEDFRLILEVPDGPGFEFTLRESEAVTEKSEPDLEALLQKPEFNGLSLRETVKVLAEKHNIEVSKNTVGRKKPKK